MSLSEKEEKKTKPKKEKAEIVSVRPLYTNVPKNVHPAIGVVDGTGYVGVWMTAHITDSEGKEYNKDLLFFVTDKHKVIRTDEEILKGQGWKLQYAGFQTAIYPRWNIADIEHFVREPEKRINPLDVFIALKKSYEEFIDFTNDESYTFNALWDIGTYFYHLFHSYPYCYIGGMHATGKSKVLNLSFEVAFNALFSGNISSASLYRAVQSTRCTFLIDETEKLAMSYGQMSEAAADFRNLILLGYKEKCVIMRCDKDANGKIINVEYEGYCPKRLANIGGIDEVVESRCIVLYMLGSSNPNKKNSDIEDTDPRWERIRDGIYRMYLENWKEVQEKYKLLSDAARNKQIIGLLKPFAVDVSEEDLGLISGRQLELWKPILALALFFDGKGTDTHITQEMIQLAVGNIRMKLSESLTETSEILLIKTLVEMVHQPDWKDGFVSFKNIRERLGQKFEDPTERWLSTRWISRSMRKLGFGEKRSTGKERQVRITRLWVEKAALRQNVPLLGSCGLKMDGTPIAEEQPITEEELVVQGGTLSFFTRPLKIDPEKRKVS